MGDVQIKTETIKSAHHVMLKLGGLRIEVPIADYRAMLAAIDADVAELHRTAVARERCAFDRMLKSLDAVKELREIIYEKEGDYYLLRDKPDAAALDAFLDKWAKLMGFE